MSPEDERQWGALAHGLSLVVFVLTLNGWIAALGIYFAYRERSKFVAFHALQALFFQLLLILCGIAGLATMMFGVGFVILAAVGLAAIAAPIMAGLAASKGDWYELPLVGSIAKRSIG